MKKPAPVKMPEGLDFEEATRKPFAVIAVQVTMDNLQKTAEWCKGTIGTDTVKMMGAPVELPCVFVPGNGLAKGSNTTAIVGMYIVEHRGAFRAYRADQYASTFDKKPKAPEPLTKGSWVRVCNKTSDYFGRVGQVYEMTEPASPDVSGGLLGVDFGAKLYAGLESTAPFYVTELEHFNGWEAQ